MAKPGKGNRSTPTLGSGNAWSVVASQESMGGTGSCGHAIQASGYSELSTVPQGTSSDFAALGRLPCGTVLKISANGKTVTAAKQDVGAGSAFLPVMGLYPDTAKALGLSGGQYRVTIERADGGTLKPVRGTPAQGGGMVNAAGNPAGGSGGASGSGGGPLSLLTVLGDLVSGNIGDLAGKLALAMAVAVKDAAIGFGDYVIIPFWHWNERSVMSFYNDILMHPKGKYQAWQTWPFTAVFWGFGYVLLFTDPDSGSLSVAPARKSRIARHAQRAQALPARRSLTKPASVKEKTPTKPKPSVSAVPVTQVGTLTTERNRPVKVHGRHDGKPTAGSERVKRVSTLTADSRTRKSATQDKNRASHAKPDAHHSSRKRPSPGR